MSFGLGDITAHAQRLVGAGELAGARELLDEALATVDPLPAHASPELTEAAGLQARVLVALGEPHAARGWAAFAHSAAARLYGPQDERTVAATATLAAVLHRVGSHARAAHLYRNVIAELSATDGPESLRVLAAHADLATVEYARGQCEVARNRLADAWELHREVYGDGHPAGIKMLARLGGMERDCGHSTEAHEHFALARELCREHLPADHPLAPQVAGLTEAEGDPEHVCETAPPRASGPAPSPPADEPWWPPEPAQPDEDGSETTGMRTPKSPLAPGFVPAARAAAGAPPAELTGPTPRSAAHLPVPVDNGPRRRTQPLVVATLVGVLIIAVTVIVSLALTRDPAPRATTPTASASAIRTASPSASPLSTTAVAPSRTPPPAPRGAPPTGVTLRDNRDSVTLAWTYPPGAEGPVLVAGGRTGQQPRAFQELPAGTTTYVVYGLDDRTDYCFTVAVVYSTDTVGRSAPVCTARTDGSAR